MFPGLRSRCSIPCACANWTASANVASSRATSINWPAATDFLPSPSVGDGLRGSFDCMDTVSDRHRESRALWLSKYSQEFCALTFSQGAQIGAPVHQDALQMRYLIFDFIRRGNRADNLLAHQFTDATP